MPAATVLFHRLALREYHQARQWYAQRSALAALRFQDAVNLAVAKIAGASNQWPVFQGNYHWVRAGRFPHVLYYRILDATHVLVIAVAHTRRRPGYWLRRRPT